MPAKKLNYDFLNKDFDEPLAVNDFIYCEVVAKVNTKTLPSGIVYQVNDQADKKPYLIVRQVPYGASKKLNVSPGDVIEQVTIQLMTFTGTDGGRYCLVKPEDIGLVYHRLNSNPEEYVTVADLDLSGRPTED